MQGCPVVVRQEKIQLYAKRKLELSVLDGCILWSSRVIVPSPGQAQVMDALHDAHPGISRMKSLARSCGGLGWTGL